MDQQRMTLFRSHRVVREVGGGIGLGNTCKSMADSCQCMTKPLQCCKVINLQLVKINEKKKKKKSVAKIIVVTYTPEKEEK